MAGDYSQEFTEYSDPCCLFKPRPSPPKFHLSFLFLFSTILLLHHTLQDPILLCTSLPFNCYFCPSLPSLFPSSIIVTMEGQDQINTLEGGLRHLRMRDSDELVKYAIPTENVPRPGFNATGKEIEVAVNAYGITKYPNRTVYQYDVSSWSPSLMLPCLWHANTQHRSILEMAPRKLPSSIRSGTRTPERTPFVRPSSTDKNLHGACCRNVLSTLMDVC